MKINGTIPLTGKVLLREHLNKCSEEHIFPTLGKNFWSSFVTQSEKANICVCTAANLLY